jgi:hypothetical protein
MTARERLLTLAACAAVVGGLGGARFGVASSGPNEVGLTDAQRMAVHHQGWVDYESHYRAWLAGIDMSKLNWSTLSRHALNASYAPPEPTLDAAILKADYIIEGSVTEVRPTVFSGTSTTIRVYNSMKGSPGSSIEIVQMGGLEPTSDWQGVTIVSAENAPFMVPGDQALLFVFKNSQGRLETEGWNGSLQIEDGLIQVPGDVVPYASELRGRTKAQVEGTILAAAQRLLGS